jgi:hypothetical protein
MSRLSARWIALAVLASLASIARAQQTPVRGHIKGQEQYLSAAANSVSNTLGYADATATSLDLRVVGSWTVGRFGFDADYLLQAVTGDAVELRNLLETIEPELFADRAETQWLPLDDTLTDREDTRAVQSLDRFSVSYTSEQWVFKLGRQAYSWGNGVVFRPLDLFDPFAPDVIDDSYKPGIDAIYTQRLFTDGSDLATLIVPRRDPATGDLANAQSSAAVKWHKFGASLQTDLLVARDYLDTVIGLGLSGSLGQAVWRLSLVPTWLDRGGTRTSLVVNVEHAWQWQGRDLSGFLEYFRNGFGRADRGYSLDELDAELTVRLARGQVFVTGRDYIAAGLRMQLTPLLEIDPVLITNLNDLSALALVRGSYSMTQNLSLDFGLRGGLGPDGTEFGGLRSASDRDDFVAPAGRVYLRIARYF